MLEVTKGRLNKQIAAKFKISEFTVKVHRAHLMHKMRAKTDVDQVKMGDELQAQIHNGVRHRDWTEPSQIS
jgi:FixJ family two-component response regulator